MKKLYTLLLSAGLLSFVNDTAAQCPASYNQASLNWDNLDYYYNSGLNTAPYGYRVSSTNFTYVSDVMEQTQRFAIGTNFVTIATNTAALVNPGAGLSVENGTHTGDITGYTGEDVQYNPTATTQTITLTFNTPVRNVNFALYDIDRGASITVSAADAAAGALFVTATPQGTTILTVTGAINKTITDNTNTNLGNADNRGTVTIGVAGTNPNPVKTVTITITTLGSDPQFWLSDIFACVTGTFPTQYHQKASNHPFVGPTQNQPDYFLVTPDNDSAYMVDPATGRTRFVFNDPSKTYINSFGYDPYNRFLYFISENPSIDYTNKTIKKYDYNTETITTFITDITAAPFNIPTFDGGVESAGCSFYDGALYFGIEGGTHSTGGSTPTITTRETIIYRINLDASGNPINAVQVFATNASTSGTGTQTSIHDWGDFIIKNGTIYNSNTARNSCGSSCSNYSQSKFHIYDLMSGTVTNTYNNPGTSIWNGQIAMGWSENLYYFRAAASGGTSVVGTYNGASTLGSPITITQVGGGSNWPGGAGDASDPFRPKCDFGDAPSSYDPYTDSTTQSPAVHERADTMWIGTTTVESTSWSREFWKRGVNGSADTDNGISTVPFLRPGVSQNYVAQVSLYNGTTSNVRLIAWLDFNGNGTFEASEAATLAPTGDIAPGAGIQTRFIYWTGITPGASLVLGSSTYLRVRLTNASAGMTTSHPTGYFEKGEVEDYRVPVDNYPLATQLLDFKALLKDNTVVSEWKVSEDATVYAYEVERSTDNTNWSKVTTVKANGTTGDFTYQATDQHPLKGVSYYRLRIVEATGMNRVSNINKISYNEFLASLSISPNPAREQTKLTIDVNEEADGLIQVFNMQGKEVITQKRKLRSGSNIIDLPLATSLGAGMYTVRVTTGEKVLNQKLIINR
ncbi:MAG: T9SS type A sorting domain-containing protein [Bacteroidetes bacterium]|nr:T9SS type A sorting domain-containing protein [Bacteroidota bacterium]